MDRGADAALLRLGVARSLAVDALTVEIVGAFEGAGIPTLLLKGPSVAGWLYSDGVRTYSDSDLLVAPQHHARAEQLLGTLGFSPAREDQPRPAHGLVHSRPWERDLQSPQIDLHRSLFGAGVAPESAWRTAWAHTDVMTISHREVRTLDRPGVLLVIVLHAEQHGAEAPGPMEDLQRAIARATREEWGVAAEMATELDAVQTFANGLRLAPEGERLASTLPVYGAAVTTQARGGRDSAPLAVGFERLAETRGLRAKVSTAFREAFPGAPFLRWWSPLARRGRLGLAFAALWRPLWLLWHTPTSWLAWRRAKRL